MTKITDLIGRTIGEIVYDEELRALVVFDNTGCIIATIHEFTIGGVVKVNLLYDTDDNLFEYGELK